SCGRARRRSSSCTRSKAPSRRRWAIASIQRGGVIADLPPTVAAKVGDERRRVHVGGPGAVRNGRRRLLRGGSKRRCPVSVVGRRGLRVRAVAAVAAVVARRAEGGRRAAWRDGLGGRGAPGDGIAAGGAGPGPGFAARAAAP